MLVLYSSLLEGGTSMQEIDSMDIFYYFDILAYRHRKETQPKFAYIDEILPI